MPVDKKKILCISASNTYRKGEASTSTKVCKLIKRIITERTEQVNVEIIQLMKMKIKFCLLCGDCFEEGVCPYDSDFNEFFQKLKDADVIFFVVPCYTPIPAKLVTVFEKIDENLYANMLRIPRYRSPLYDKITAIIGHGGMAESEESLEHYHEKLISPVANTLASFGFKIIGLNDKYTLGVPFGLKDDTCIQPVEDSVFPDVIQDWDHIEARIKPLVEKVLYEMNVE